MVRNRLIFAASLCVVACGGDDPGAGTASDGTATDGGGDEAGNHGLPGPGWSTRRRLTLSEDVLGLGLTNIPVLVKLDDDRITYDLVNDFAPDIRFYDGALETELPYEIERWNPDGDSFVWVRLNVIDDSEAGSSFFMYFDNADIGDGQSPGDVWGDGYRAVWHMQVDDAGEMPDATGNGHTGVFTGGGASASTSELVGGALGITGSMSYLEVAHDANLIPGQTMTIEGWASPDILDDLPRHLVRKRDAYAIEVATEGDGVPRGVVWFEESADRAVTDDAPLQEDRFTHLAMVYDGASATFELYIDGELAVEREPPADPAAASDTTLDIGLEMYGLIDEVRISSVVRSSDFMKTQRRGTLDNLFSFGPNETPP